MTISTPQPEYISETHEVVDEALEQREDDSTQESFKLVPTPGDWMGANREQDTDMIECPVCQTPVRFMAVDSHTAWHQTLANIIALLAGN